MLPFLFVPGILGRAVLSHPEEGMSEVPLGSWKCPGEEAVQCALCSQAFLASLCLKKEAPHTYTSTHQCECSPCPPLIHAYHVYETHIGVGNVSGKELYPEWDFKNEK